jgi:5-oxoprolinase (ATP-hydrolysing) subunit A
VKPHGALYNLAAVQPELARAIAEAVRDLDKQLILFALSGSELVKAGRQAGLTVAEEAFADRTYQPDGSLTPRRHPKAVIHDIHAAARQVISMVKDRMVTTVEGTVVPLRADTICVHGDHPGAVSFVSRLRKQLEDEGIVLRPAGDRFG